MSAVIEYLFTILAVIYSSITLVFVLSSNHVQNDLKRLFAILAAPAIIASLLLAAKALPLDRTLDWLCVYSYLLPVVPVLIIFRSPVRPKVPLVVVTGLIAAFFVLCEFWHYQDVIERSKIPLFSLKAPMVQISVLPLLPGYKRL